ncbi:MAG: FAD-dependent oxidoreductase [Saprospiraceae bacterium]|nr:FAD-dependent oxidoreductase [Saprospiraceae bacterium]
MAIIKKYPAEVIEVNNNFDGIYTVTFKSLKGKFKFNPGQFLHLALEEYDPSKPWPESRCFSMQSSPEREFVKITYSVKGLFTSRMSKILSPGINLTLKMPYGNLFSQDHSKENSIFISGGTGITPFLSLFTDNKFTEYKDPVLYAGFRSENLNLFREELKKAKLINPSFKIVNLFEDISGIIDIEKIYTDIGNKSTYFISGPPIMIKSFKEYLVAQKLNEAQILFDDWG